MLDYNHEELREVRIFIDMLQSQTTSVDDLSGFGFAMTLYRKVRHVSYCEFPSVGALKSQSDFVFKTLRIALICHEPRERAE